MKTSKPPQNHLSEGDPDRRAQSKTKKRRLSLLITALLTLSGTDACSQASHAQANTHHSTDPKTIDRAALMIDLGRYKDAMELVKELSINNSPEALYLLGRAQYGTGNYVESEKIYAQVVSITPNDPRPYIGLGMIYGKQGDMNKAILFFTKAINANKKYAKAYINRGVALGAIGKQKKALEDFSTAIELDPRNADGYRNRGIINEALGNINAACSDWASAASLGQDNPKEWLERQCKKK